MPTNATPLRLQAGKAGVPAGIQSVPSFWLPSRVLALKAGGGFGERPRGRTGWSSALAASRAASLLGCVKRPLLHTTLCCPPCSPLLPSPGFASLVCTLEADEKGRPGSLSVGLLSEVCIADG